ncbi:MarR family winged helix-turn-helix transcriptional regulator [Anaerosalibacter massiliensis]|uniref:MarR family transcriptional regulator n=1 Tax=Anaerosalibacter massiliensis TaxID=1347392 RepID=A0A9X2S7T5_9FIRM|nr:MarR family transcriptional regulator [Anaerosalibacter massiliensis]MCR2044356.1 MarR family transcriptional regulator [Anaerosalibacter massiliensis]
MFDLDTCVAFITNKAAKKMADAFNERLSKLGITRVQWIALFYLGKEEGISQKELGELMDIKDSTVARLIDRMEKEEYVYRKKDSLDRRITNIYLTEKGKEYRKELLPEGEEMARIFANGISDEEMDIFINVVNKMLSNIGEKI